MEFVDISSNNLSYIGSNIFDDLPKLTHIDLSRNSGLKKLLKVANSSSAITEMKRNLAKQFTDEPEVYYAKQNSDCGALKKIIDVMTTAKITCQDSLLTVQDDLSDMQQSHENLTLDLENCIDSFDDCNSTKVIELKNEVSNLKLQIVTILKNNQTTCSCKDDETLAMTSSSFESDTDKIDESSSKYNLLLIFVAVLVYLVVDLAVAVAVLMTRLSFQN